METNMAHEMKTKVTKQGLQRDTEGFGRERGNDYIGV